MKSILAIFLLIGLCQYVSSTTYTVSVSTRTQLVNAISPLVSGDKLIVQSTSAVTIGTTVTLGVPNVEVTGLWLQAQSGVEDLTVFLVTSDNVNINNFKIIGNEASTSQIKGYLLRMEGSGFLITNGRVTNAAKNGIMIGFASDTVNANITGGTVSHIVGDNNVRDTVSLTGHGEDGTYINDVTVDTVAQYHSGGGRGAVEVSDGTNNILVKNIWAQNSDYAVDVQDHGDLGQSNKGVTLQNITSTGCYYTIRTSNSAAFGHRGLYISTVSGSNWPTSVTAGDVACVQVENTHNVTITGVTSVNAPYTVWLDNDKYVDLSGVTEGTTTATECIHSEDTRYLNLWNIYCANTKPFMRFLNTDNIVGTATLSNSVSGKIKLDTACSVYSFAYPANLIVVT
jgi:hypothetical protein